MGTWTLQFHGAILQCIHEVALGNECRYEYIATFLANWQMAEPSWERQMGINNAYATESHVPRVYKWSWCSPTPQFISTSISVAPAASLGCSLGLKHTKFFWSSTLQQQQLRSIPKWRWRWKRRLDFFCFFFSGDNLRHCGACCDVFLPGPIDPWEVLPAAN